VQLNAGALVWNILSTIIVVAGGARGGIDIFTAFLWCLFGNLISIAAFYLAYRSIASRLRKWQLAFFVAEGILLTLFLVAWLTDSGNWHGMTTLGDTSGVKFAGGLIVMTLLDCAALGVCMGYGGWLVYKYYKFHVLTQKDSRSSHRASSANAPADAHSTDADPEAPAAPVEGPRASGSSSGSAPPVPSGSAASGGDIEAGPGAPAKKTSIWSRFF